MRVATKAKPNHTHTRIKSFLERFIDRAIALIAMLKSKTSKGIKSIFSTPSSIKLKSKNRAQSKQMYAMIKGVEKLKNCFFFSAFSENAATMYEMNRITDSQKATARTALKGVSNKTGYHVTLSKRDKRNIKPPFVPPYSFY